VLILRSENAKNETPAATPPASTAPPAHLTLNPQPKSLDPFGDNVEDDSQLGNAVDGNPTTFWHTEFYSDRHFSSNPAKKGVGIIVSTSQPAKLGQLTVTSPTQDWAASVYVSDQSHTTLADWGQPVDQKANIAGNATFDLHGTQGQYILLWITDLGTGPPGPGAVDGRNVTVMINEMGVNPAT
jgi:hypothetical protein